jgi:hypothetical protein
MNGGLTRLARWIGGSVRPLCGTLQLGHCFVLRGRAPGVRLSLSECRHFPGGAWVAEVVCSRSGR